VAVINQKRSLLSRVGRWAAELLLVFVGVYGAFWLNSYQQHREDAGRRDQILASFEQQLREGIESGKINRAKQEQKAAEFRRATKKLRKRFEIYPDALDANVQFANELERTHTELLKRIQAERQRNINIHSHHVILSEAKNLRLNLELITTEIDHRCLKAWPHASHFVAALRSI